MIELLVCAQGLIRAIYFESIPIKVLGTVQIERASQVEPDAQGNWWADLKLSNGPILGPFPCRSQALQAEHDWLTKHVLFGPTYNSMKVENLTDATIPSNEVTSISTAPASNAL